MEAKQDLDFIVLTSLASPGANMSSVFSAILISKSVSWGIFDTQLVYFIRKLATLVILDRKNVVSVSFYAV